MVHMPYMHGAYMDATDDASTYTIPVTNMQSKSIERGAQSRSILNLFFLWQISNVPGLFVYIYIYIYIDRFFF